MRYREKTPDEIYNDLDAMREVEIHDMAEAELWEIVSAISEAHENLGDAVRDWLSETLKTILGEIPYDMSGENGPVPSEGLLDGLLSDPSGALKVIADNAAIFSIKAGEFKRLLASSGLTLQERTVVVLHYIHGKSDHESSIMTGYEDTEGILWTALVKIGHMLWHDKRR